MDMSIFELMDGQVYFRINAHVLTTQQLYEQI